MTRTILVPLTVRAPEGEDRPPQELAQAIVDSLSVDPEVIDCDISAGIAEEVQEA